MRKLSSVLLIVSILVFLIPLGEVFSAVTLKNITINPSIISQQGEIRVYFLLGESLPASSKIYLKFPIGFSVPSILNKDFVELGGVTPQGVVVDGNTLIITTSQSIQKNQGAPDGYPLVIESSSGIINPSSPDTYTFEMWTELENAHVSYDVFIGIASSGTQVSNLSVQLDDSSKAGEATTYTISFRVSSEGILMSTKNDYVDIYFPKGTIFPDIIKPEQVFFNIKNCERVEREDRRIRVYVPENWVIFPFTISSIIFSKDFGLINPEFTGKYAIQMSTSKDTGLATSALYQIYGTPLLSATATINPSSQMSPTELKLILKQQPFSSLTAEKSKINVKFPPEFALPRNIIPGAVTVNGTPCTKVQQQDTIITLFSPVNVGGIDDVVVVFKKEFGIKNPSELGNYEILVNTSSDAELVSCIVSTTVTTVSNVSVTLSNTSAGQVSRYEISFKTGLNGRLLPGIDRINVVFPIGTTIPSVIPVSQVLINGNPATLVEINGTTITLTPAFEIPADSVVNVEFREGAALRNPVNSGNFVIYIHTSKEQTSVSSNSYSIKNVPSSSVSLNPPAPDGLGGFYKVKPQISFTASSATDPDPSVFYYFDNNQPTLYQGSAILAPEGIHTLFYFSVDKDGRKEETKSVQIKVDTIPPVISIIYPLNNSIQNSQTVVVKGNVDPGSNVKVNGESVQTDGLGNFETSLKLLSNPDIINVTAVDAAGNSSQASITVAFDTTPPPLTITKPLMFQQVSKLPLVVEGNTEPGASVTVNGEKASVDETGNYKCLLSALPEGVITSIEVIATDAAGNTTKRVVSVKYSKSISVILQISNTFALVNGQTFTLEAAPVISSGRTMVPLRFVGESFGAEFTYEPLTKTIDITFGSDKITMQIGNKTASVNGTLVALDVAPYIVNGRTLVPIRFISEAFGAEVVWDGTTKTVTIIYPKP